MKHEEQFKDLIAPAEAKVQLDEKIRQRAFAAGRPVVTLSDDEKTLIKEYEDGTIKEVSLER